MDDREIEQALAGIMIQLARIYDLLVLGIDDEEWRNRILAIHEQGDLLSSAPFLSEKTFRKWNDEENDDTIDDTVEKGSQ